MKFRELCVIAAIVLGAALISVSAGAPSKARFPLLRLILPRAATEAPAPERPRVVLQATPPEHLADNEPVLRSTGPDGHPLIDYTFGW